ncbi:MAG: hypothetical protein AB1725_05045 [Armatimonadota bacterium]
MIVMHTVIRHLLEYAVRGVARWAVVFFVCGVLLASCAGKKEAANLAELADRIQAGMSQDEVLKVAGEPADKLQRTWIYKNPGDFDQILVVVFQGDKVEGVRLYTPPEGQDPAMIEPSPSDIGGAAGG